MVCETPSALIVDDEQPILDFFGVLLKLQGFTVDGASTIGEAERFFRDNKYDLIFVDIYLGKETGIDLLKTIRTLDKNANVVIMTGMPDFESAVEALQLRAIDYLTKPISLEKIISIARRALSRKKLLEANIAKQASLNAIFHNVSDGIILVDRDNRLVQVNETAMRSCGYTLDHSGVPVTPPEADSSCLCRQTLAKVLQDGVQRIVRRHECCNSTGTTRIVSIIASPVTKDNGMNSGAVAVFRNDTDPVLHGNQLNNEIETYGMIGNNVAMKRMYSLIKELANVQTTVLINSETGTGKELVAAALHHQGIRRDKPFVKVNCSALSEHLLESELFGHVRGAFTGAVTDKTGRFERADGGTIFLDEIGDISPAMQMRLLRVLQEQEFERVGDTSTMKIDVRVIAATNQNLEKKVRLGTFRQDLFYRLNVVRLVVPPLRDRSDDIFLLTDHFMKKFSRKFNRPYSAPSDEVMELFMHHSWPGNVRELEHTLEHAALFCRSNVIAVEDLPQRFMDSVRHLLRKVQHKPVRDQQKELEEALKNAGGNKAKAARLLGVSRCTVYRWLQESSSLFTNPQQGETVSCNTCDG